MKSLIYLAFSFSLLDFVSAQDWESFYQAETLTPPSQRWVPSGMALHKESQIAFTTNRGEVWVANYKQGFQNLKWQQFATGLRSPSEIQSNGNIFVRQNKATWTLLKDKDNNGVADTYLDQSPAQPQSTIPSPFSGMVWSPPKKAAPFKDQHFGFSAGDQYLSRMTLITNQSGKHYTKLTLQDGFRFPIEGMLVLPDNSWIVSQTNRTDPSRTRLRSVLQRLIWKTPLASFEIEKIVASSDCFTISFTEPLNPETAQATWSYAIQRMPDQQQATIKKLALNPSNSKEVSIYLDTPIEPNKFYQISCEAIWSANRNPVRNPTALFIWQPNPTDR